MFHVEKHICLSRDVQVTDVTWLTVTMIEARVGDLVQRTEDDQTHVGYLVAGRSRGQVTLCVVYTVHKEMRSVDFLVQPLNQGRRFLQIGPQNQPMWFGDLTHKITATVSWFVSQNQVGNDLSVVS
jgi:hypothetical protein